jgi:hypothetical protein
MRTAQLAAVTALVLVAGAAPARAASLPGASAASRTLVVSPHGSDSAAGTASRPLRTIQVAVDRLRAGGRVELRGGVYHQRVRLVGVHDVRLAPYGHERVTVSGSGLTPPHGLTALVEIADSSAVTVSGLDLTGYWSSRLGVVPAGVYVHGYDRGVTVAGNHVHDLGNTNGTLGSFDINAHGIAVYGDDPHGSVTGLSIRDNVVDHLRLGASETVVVNGNVNGWAITGNRIEDDDNIGIDAIGFEPTLTGAYRYTTANRARNGVIAGNHVSRIQSRGNPAYWEGGPGAQAWCNCADGIYVDGGTHILISGNRVQDSDIGIEVAAENAHGSADHVVVRGNRVTGSLFTGITTGGYCNGAQACGGVRTGTSHDNLFEDNWLRGNNRLDDGSPELLVQYYASNDTFRHNTIIATNSAHVVYGTVPGGTEHGDRSDHNTFRVVGAGPAAAQFGWSGRTYTGFGAYRRATGQDAHSTIS